ncbi:hypothetical protein EAI_16714 [Harpegnathos saltator]|uniref:Uncharacterized protein n=1 Tax=Harpegnathos saltator TaxID=610380 RepID=E2BMP5_HARSA|nr:hypothetical protein EAI_16714 [Harpegnathos saltator]
MLVENSRKPVIAFSARSMAKRIFTWTKARQCPDILLLCRCLALLAMSVTRHPPFRLAHARSQRQQHEDHQLGE